MKFVLEDYQQRAVGELLRHIAKARRDYADDGEHSAIGLTAPTGAGKTVIATAVLEGLYLGSPGREPDPALTVLWLTDDKSLNAQTISKILQASGGKIDANRVRFIWDSDERTLEPGYIYFVHIQAMQKKSTLHANRPDGSRSDQRTHGPWEMIANTVAARGKDFLVIWDEAHRGTGTTASERNTIAGTIVNGGTTNIGTSQPAAPVILGISATPDRFRNVMVKAGRTMRLVDVPASEVRKSGLLKDRILLRSLAEGQSADSTMLTMAVGDLMKADRAWREHHAETGDRPVEPLLVVQVPLAATAARLGEILDTIESAWPELTDYAVAHAFGDPHGPLRVGDRTVRYLAPEAIAGDDRARVVLFKSALTTGWDCPRAEVLVSFQGKDSYTEIAQLIGRLVRTPLARRIENGDDRLNEVVAYLPGFKSSHVARVVAALTEDETLQVPVLIEPEACVPSQAVPRALFDLLDTLPSYTRGKRQFPSRTSQLMRLAAALNEHGLETAASRKARRWIVDQVRALDGQRSAEIDAQVRDILALSVETTVVGYGEAIMLAAELTDVAVVERDLGAYFARAQLQLPDGSASWYFNDLCDRGHDDSEASARVAALAGLGFRAEIEAQAEALICQWRQAHTSAVARLPRQAREAVEPLWQLGSSPMMPTTVLVPPTYRAATQKVVRGDVAPVDMYPGHMFVVPDRRPGAGLFPVDTSRSSWERAVLDRELGAASLAGWYRNPSSGRHALAVAYETGHGTFNLMHPDFLFFHNDGDDIVIDIVDPHRHDQTDAAAKWGALAQYAQDHADRVRRVIAVIEDSTRTLRALDLTARERGDQLATATDRNLMEDLFQEEGYVY